MAEEAFIRKYQAGDRDAVRRIAVATAMAGRPGSLFMDGDELLADALTLYFTDHEPESCFVALRDGKVVGYIIGAVDTRKMDGIVSRRIVWPLIFKALLSGALLKPRNLAMLWRLWVSFIRGELRAPSVYGQYPATLHINLDEQARGQGAGAGLMRNYLSYLLERGVKGVQMATMSKESGEFFKKQGFKLLHEGRRSYFQHVLARDISVYIFARQLIT